MKRSIQCGRVLVVILCAALAFFMTVEVAHSHSGEAGDTAPIHCQLCASAHIAIASQPAWLTGHIFHLIAIVSIGQPATGSPPAVSTAFIRPPPVAPALFS